MGPWNNLWFSYRRPFPDQISGQENIQPTILEISQFYTYFPEIWFFGKWGKVTTDQYTSWPNGILKYSNVRLSWVHFRSTEPHLYKSIRKPCAQSEYSDQHGHMLCALGLRCVFNARRDAKKQYFLIHKREDPYQIGRMPTHGEWMLF